MKRFLALFVAFAALAAVAPAVARHRPEIVNPPRPTHKFKYLIVVKQGTEKYGHVYARTHYVYANDFHVENVEDGGFTEYYLVIYGDNEICTPDWDEGPCNFVPLTSFNYLSMTNKGMVTLAWRNKHLDASGMRLIQFLVAKAPQPKKVKKYRKTKKYPQLFEPKNARVVFHKK